MDSARVDALDEGRLAGLLIDSENGDRILAAGGDALTAEIHGAARTVRQVYKTAVRMYVNGCHGLAAVTVAGLSQRVLHEKRAGAQRAIRHSAVNVELV